MKQIMYRVFYKGADGRNITDNEALFSSYIEAKAFCDLVNGVMDDACLEIERII